MGRRAAVNAYAARVTEQNLAAIISEGGRKFDVKTAKAWLAIEDVEAFFVRDEGSALDCQIFEGSVFHQIYAFEHADDGALFRRIVNV